MTLRLFTGLICECSDPLFYLKLTQAHWYVPYIFLQNVRVVLKSSSGISENIPVKNESFDYIFRTNFEILLLSW